MIPVFYLVFAPHIIGLFTTVPEVIVNGALCLRIIAAGYIFYGYGMVIVPTTDENVVEVSGSHDVVRRANNLGLNDMLLNRDWGDPYSAADNGDGSNVENLFPLMRPLPESGPWEWWDPACPNHTSSLETNQDMTNHFNYQN